MAFLMKALVTTGLSGSSVGGSIKNEESIEKYCIAREVLVL